QLSLEGGPQPRCRAAFDRCPICKAWVRHAVVLVVNPSARARGREGTIRGADALPTASTSGPGSASRSRRGAGAPFAPERTGAQIVDHSLPWSILRPETGRSHSSSTRFRAPPGDEPARPGRTAAASLVKARSRKTGVSSSGDASLQGKGAGIPRRAECAYLAGAVSRTITPAAPRSPAEGKLARPGSGGSAADGVRAPRLGERTSTGRHGPATGEIFPGERAGT